MDYLNKVFGDRLDEVLEKCRYNKYFQLFLHDESNMELPIWVSRCVKETRKRKGLDGYVFSFEDGNGKELLKEIQASQEFSIENEIPLLYIGGVVLGYRIAKKGILITSENFYSKKNGINKGCSILNATYIADDHIALTKGDAYYPGGDFSKNDKFELEMLIEALIIVVQFFHYIGRNEKTPMYLRNKNINFVEPLSNISHILNDYIVKPSDRYEGETAEEKIVNYLINTFDEKTLDIAFATPKYGKDGKYEKYKKITGMILEEEPIIVFFSSISSNYGMVINRRYLYYSGKNGRGKVLLNEIINISTSFMQNNSKVIINNSVVIEFPFFGLVQAEVDRFVSMIPVFIEWIIEEEGETRINEEQKEIDYQTIEEAESQLRLAEEEKTRKERSKAQDEIEHQVRIEAEQQAQIESEEKIREGKKRKAQEEIERQAKIAAEQKIKEELDEIKANAEAEALKEAREKAELKAKEEAKKLLEKEERQRKREIAKENRKKNPSHLAVVSLICSILSWVTIITIIPAFILAIIGIVSGIKSRQSDKKKMAWAGIIISLIYFIFWIVIIILAGCGIIG